MGVHRAIADDARNLLLRNGYRVWNDGSDDPTKSIISVDHDSICYLGVLKQANTAWLDGGRVVSIERGFSSVPPHGLHDDRYVDYTGAT